MNKENNMSDVENEKNITEQYEDLVKEIGLDIKSKFIPFSVSRNSNEEHKSLNWKVTISNGKQEMTVDYSKGVGHLPYPQNNYGLNLYQKKMINEAIDSAIETGVARKLVVANKDAKFALGNAAFPNPTLQEVLYSLCLDSDVRHYLTYEQWADDFGYDKDSRKGEQVYNECRKQTADFMKLIGYEDKLVRLHEVLYEMDNQSVTVQNKPKI